MRKDWHRHQHVPGTVHAGWRHERRLYTLALPAVGWFVDIEHSASVAMMRQVLGNELAALGLGDLTVATLRAEDWRVTTLIASWIRRQVLDDGSLPYGIRNGSKHGSDWNCWAVWLRVVDDGGSVRREPTGSDGGAEVLDRLHNPVLRSVSDLFGLKIW